MTDESPAAVVDRRLDTLRALDEGAASRATLADRAGVSRSTVDRALRELSTVGFVTSTPAGYRPTLPGRLALSGRDRHVRRIEALAAVAPLFEGVEVGLDVDPAVFEGATVVEATPHAPTDPLDAVADVVGTATHVSVYTGRFLSRHARLYHDRIMEAGTTGAFVTTERVIERLAASRPVDTRDAVASGRVAIRRTNRDEPLTVVLAETPDGPEVGLVVYRGGAARGFVGNDDPAATRWARALHERLWAAGTPFDPI
ncbi:helix-turn-helix transcriptional regulator [Haloplanus halophilus]|uniref:helix-turn-helix transcriptional regulator n=1 Tax=Haloplanus halophilus TaxID=2949993 RepID=UPI00204165D6|nr:HTH domain-containing protein [Haloplanus sp. GDY1]